MKPARQPVARVLLQGLAVIYKQLVGLRNRHYDRAGRSYRAALPVLSVGNLTVGGTGKTPTVAWIVERLLARGRRPAVVSRGYGGDAGSGPLVVSTGDGPLCPAETSGDEPWLLARELTGAFVVVGSDRRLGVEKARQLGADTVVLDDGFQHRRLARELDIVLLDAEKPFGNGYLLPAGPLREPVEGLARANVVIVTRSDPAGRYDLIEKTVRKHNPAAPILRAGHRRVGFFDADGHAAPRPTRVMAFCGIGNPESFRSDLQTEGCEVARFSARRDHHRYSDAELVELRRSAELLDAVPVTTEKDLARLGGRSPFGGGRGLLVLRIAVVVYDPEPLDDAISAILSRTGRARTPGMNEPG